MSAADNDRPRAPVIEPIAPDEEVAALLLSSGLPVDDIRQEKALAFFGCRVDGRLVALVGMETGVGSALLRSLTVVPEQRGRGLAERLVAFVEHLCGARGLETIYLLTESAADYFRQRGYEDTARARAPDWIRAGTQFSQLCPEDAAFLSKSLRA